MNLKSLSTISDPDLLYKTANSELLSAMLNSDSLFERPKQNLAPANVDVALLSHNGFKQIKPQVFMVDHENVSIHITSY